MSIGSIAPGFPFAVWQIIRLASAPPPEIPETRGPWRPLQWSKPQLTSITANLPATSTVSHNISFGDVGSGNVGSGSTTTPTTTPTTYFFDAILRLQHVQELRATEHPVQATPSGGGTPLVDHSYIVPARLTIEIGMSDAMDRFQAGTFTSDASKSVSAYKTLITLQALRIPLTVATRLNTYQNMIIESIRVPDDNRTLHGLRAIVEFRQIMTGIVASQTVSARPQQTGESAFGTKQTLPVSPAIQAAHKVAGTITVPLPNGAGLWSSENVTLIPLH